MTKISKVSKELAIRVGRKIPAEWDRDQVRDYLDQATGAELDTFQLDLLIDMALKERAAHAA